MEYVFVILDAKVDWIGSQGIISDFWKNAFEYLDFYSIYRSEIVCKKFNHIITQYNIKNRVNIRCFYTKRNIYDSGTCFGIGLIVKNAGYGNIYSSSRFNIISLKAFKLYQSGLWSEKLTHFIPLIINRSHIERHHHILMNRLELLINNNYSGWKPFWYKPTIYDTNIKNNKMIKYADTIIELMNDTITKYITNKQINLKSGVDLHTCERALIGYSTYHHILLYLCKCDQNIKKFANSKIEGFKLGHTSREYCKNLGKLLIYLMISDYNWKYIAKEFILEEFTRNVRCNCNSVPKLNSTEYIQDRLRITFDLSEISRELVLTQKWFIKHCGKITYKQYNDRLGRPPVSLKYGLQNTTKHILMSDTWEDYFKGINIVTIIFSLMQVYVY